MCCSSCRIMLQAMHAGDATGPADKASRGEAGTHICSKVATAGSVLEVAGKVGCALAVVVAARADAASVAVGCAGAAMGEVGCASASAVAAREDADWAVVGCEGVATGEAGYALVWVVAVRADAA